jgi:hypothetical protein
MALKPVDFTPLSAQNAANLKSMRIGIMPHRLRVLLAIGMDRAACWPLELSSAGYHVVTVHDLDAALDALESDTFDVFLLDLGLPEALETAKLYRFLSLDCQPVPVVGLTTRGSERDEWSDGTLSQCLRVDDGPDARMALESMFPDRFYTYPDQGEASRVVNFDAYRSERALRT